VVLQGPGLRTEVPRPALEKSGTLSRRSFWDALLDAVREGSLAYAGYSYKDRADRYRLEISAWGLAHLRENAGLLRFSALEAQIKKGSVRTVDFLVSRSA
jgi:hypothetical protein